MKPESVPVSSCIGRSGVPWVIALLAGMGGAACGGTRDAPDGSGPGTAALLQTDRGGLPADCTREAGYAFSWVDDFETGAATGWYTNTDVCQTCNDLDGDRVDLEKPIGCLLGALDGKSSERAREIRAATAVLTPPTACTPAQVVKDHYRDERLSTEEAEERAFGLLDQLVEEWVELVERFEDCGLEACRESQTPYLFDKPLRAERILGGPRCGSQYAMHIVAPRLYDFGGTLGRQYSIAEPLDLVEPTAWEGLAFWARVSPNSRNQLKVSIPERHTDERFEVNGAPVCTFDSLEDDTSMACDKHGSWVNLTENWELYFLPFSEMRQAGWGKAAPFFDLKNVLGIGFDYQAGSWDLWIDDVGFYRRK